MRIVEQFAVFTAQRVLWPCVVVLLVACSEPAPSVSTPLANIAPTQTRAAELAQLATLTAPSATAMPPATVPTATLAPATPTVPPPVTAPEKIPSQSPTMAPPLARYDLMLPADAPNAAYPGFEVVSTERYSLRLIGNETAPRSATPAPPMNGCGSRYYVLRFRTVGDAPVIVYIGGPANVSPLPGATPPAPRQISTTNAGVLVLSGCAAGLFLATTEGFIVDLVAEQTTYSSAPFAPGTAAPPSQPQSTSAPVLAPPPTPAPTAASAAPTEPGGGSYDYAQEYAAKNLECRLVNSTGEFFILVRGTAAPRFCREWRARYPTYRFFDEAHLLTTLWRDGGAQSTIDVSTTRRAADADTRWVTQETQRIWNLQ